MIKYVIAFFVVPALLFLAYRDWSKNTRMGLPQWRNSMVMAALLIVLLNWSVAVVLVVPELLHVDTSSVANLQLTAYVSAKPLDLIAIALAFALKRAARLEAILAGMLMFACWPGGYA